jgi:exonuclease SbcD
VKILHTSDWHAGKVWKGQSRLDELAAVLDDLAAAIERERIDLVLMTGDIFDTPSPPAEAERLVFGFFRRLGRLEVPSVVIAGNHDSPARVEAWAQLAELAHVRACGLPKPRSRGGCLDVRTRAGDRAVVAMVPFASPARLVSAQELGEAPDRAASTYAAEMQKLIAHVSQGFGGETVNLLMAHTHLDGALIGGSERRVHLGDDWAAKPQMLPSTAHYIALGHIHRYQQVEAAPAPTWYAGSPMQLDFGEEGHGKYYNVIDARPRQPARVEARAYVGARPLRTVTVAASDLAGGRVASSVDVSDRAHLRVIVDCSTPDVDADVNRQVRDAIPGVISVDVQMPSAAAPAASLARAEGTLAPRELYAMFRTARRTSPASAAVLDAFDDLHAAATSEEPAQ